MRMNMVRRLLLTAAILISSLLTAQELELNNKNVKAFPVARGARYPIVSSAIFQKALDAVDLNEDEISLPAEREKFRPEYVKHLRQSAAVVANVIGNKEYAVSLDDALYYAYCFQRPRTDGGVGFRTEERFVQKVQAQKYFPTVVEFSFWPWEDAGGGSLRKVNGLYVPGSISSGGTLKLSLYDFFMQEAVKKALSERDPAFTFGDGYEKALGSVGRDLAARMPILQVFIHETNHAVLEDSGDGLSSDRALGEGVTELLAQRAVHRLAGGYEDFCEVSAYPTGVFFAALLWGIDPDSLLDWYTNTSGTSMDAEYAERLAQAMMAVKNNKKEPLLSAAKKDAFKAAFTKVFLREDYRSVDDVRAVFRTNVDMRILYAWLMEEGAGIYFKQLPMKIRLFVLENFFFNIDPSLLGMNKAEFAQKVKDLRSKVPDRKNWENVDEEEINGLMEDDTGESSSVAPIQIIPADKKKVDGKEEGKEAEGLKKKNPVVLDPAGGAPEGPEEWKAKNKPFKVPVPAPVEQTGATFPPTREWFEARWKADPSSKPRNEGFYAPRREELIRSFSMDKVLNLTKELIARGGISEKIRVEWIAFLTDYVAANLEKGADQLGVPEMEGLFPPEED